MSDGDRDDPKAPWAVNLSDLCGPPPVWVTCPCGETTARVPCWTCSRAADAKREATERDAAALDSIPRRYAWAQVGHADLARRVTLRDPLTSPLAETIKRVLASSRVVFAGPSGAGKTSLGIACLRERVPHGLFVSAPRLGTARIQSAAGQGEAGIVERAIAAPLLLLDELGGEQKTATNAVRDVIFARYDADRPTWVTTGFSAAQLVEMYGDGAYRRLTEDAYVVRLGAA